MKKIQISLWLVLCSAAICAGIYLMTIESAEYANTDTKPMYTVKEYGGKVAVYTQGCREPTEVYDIYVHLLPENDIELLRKGIAIQDDYDLRKTLEDLGL